MLRPLSISMTALALLAPGAVAKPITIQLDREVAEAGHVLEGRLVEHLDGRSRVAVTGRFDRIFRGFEVAGRTLEFEWPGSGPETFRSSIGPGSTHLFVVGSNGQIVVTGTRVGEAYQVRGFCDWNAALILVEGRERSFEEEALVEADWVWERTGADPRRHAERIGRLLLDATPAAAGRRAVEAALDDLDDDDWAVRQAAEDALVGPLGVAFAGVVEARRRTAPSLEVERRLARVLERLGPWRRASGRAAGYREPGLDRWRLLAACLDAEDPALAAAAVEALRAETGQDLPLDGGAWRNWLEARPGD